MLLILKGELLTGLHETGPSLLGCQSTVSHSHPQSEETSCINGKPVIVCIEC